MTEAWWRPGPDGVTLRVVSGYRSYATQDGLMAAAARAAGGCRACVDDVAPPGVSQHQLGTALDFNAVEPAFAATPAGQWLWAQVGAG